MKETKKESICTSINIFNLMVVTTTYFHGRHRIIDHLLDHACPRHLCRHGMHSSSDFRKFDQPERRENVRYKEREREWEREREKERERERERKSDREGMRDRERQTQRRTGRRREESKKLFIFNFIIISIYIYVCKLIIHLKNKYSNF